MRQTLAILTICLVVTACSPDTDSGSATTETTTETTAATTTTSSTSSTEDPATTTAPVAAPELADCLVGSWELRTEEFLRSIYASYGGSISFALDEIGGSYVTTLDADGSFDSVRDAWTWQVTTLDGEMRTTIDGTETGTWSVDGDQLTIDVTAADLTPKTEVVVDGQVIELPPSTATVNTDIMSGTLSVRCEGDELTAFTADDAVSTFDRR